MDSSVLLHALAGLRQRLPAALKALHLDHGLQANSENWAVHCQRVCTALQVPLVVKALQLRTPNGASIERVGYGAARSLHLHLHLLLLLLLPQPPLWRRDWGWILAKIDDTVHWSFMSTTRLPIGHRPIHFPWINLLDSEGPF